MEQQPVFITDIHLHEVRHLRNVHIHLSDTERKHLILTGRNGSGKTSVLEAMGEAIKNYADSYHIVADLPEIQQKTNVVQTQSGSIKIDFNGNLDFLLINFLINSIKSFSLKIPTSIEKFISKKYYEIKEKANYNFLQYIVNLRADRSFARDENDESAVYQIDKWFERFEAALRDIFSDPTLTLTFDRANYNFTIHQQGHEPFDLNTLSDGYSAILSIVTELMMRMEGTGAKAYDAQGVVLIDEIETHLHIELQKKILPFLTAFFPNIQFIVSTHSPFVLGSIPNAVIFDLEHQQPVEDLTAYSVEAIIEAYFGQDKYADYLKKQVEQYEALVNQDVLTETELAAMNQLEADLNRSPQFFKAPELELKLRMLNRARRKKHTTGA